MDTRMDTPTDTNSNINEFYIIALSSDIENKENQMTEDILSGKQEILKTLEHAKIEAKFVAPVVKVIFNEPVHIYKVELVDNGFKYTDVGYEEAEEGNLSDKEILDLYGFTQEDVNELRDEYK